MKRKTFSLKNSEGMPFPFSLALEVDKHVYLSAQPAMSLANAKLIEGSFEQQFHKCIANLDEVLAAADLNRDNVINPSLSVKKVKEWSKALHKGVFHSFYL